MNQENGIKPIKRKRNMILSVIIIIGLLFTVGCENSYFNRNDKELNKAAKLECNTNALSDVRLGNIMINGTLQCNNYITINDKDQTEYNGHIFKILTYADFEKTKIYELQVDSDIYKPNNYNNVEIDKYIYHLEVTSYGSDGTVYTKIGVINKYDYEINYRNMTILNSNNNICSLSIKYEVIDDCFIIKFGSLKSNNSFPYLNSGHHYDGYVKICQNQIEGIFLAMKAKYTNFELDRTYFSTSVILDFSKEKCYIQYFYPETIYVVDFQYVDITILDSD